MHSVFLTGDGYIYTRGLNTNGELGLGDKEPRTCVTGNILPEKVEVLSNIATFFVTLRNTFCISHDGTIYAAGSNDHGQAGIGTKEDVFTSTEIPPFSRARITRIEGNHSETYFLDEYGDVYFCGRFNKGAWWDMTSPQKEKGLSGIVKIFSNHHFNLFLSESGKVYLRRNNLTTAYSGNDWMSLRSLNIIDVIDIQCIESDREDSVPLLLKKDGSLWNYHFNTQQLQSMELEGVKRMVTYAHHGDFHVFELMDGFLFN